MSSSSSTASKALEETLEKGTCSAWNDPWLPSSKELMLGRTCVGWLPVTSLPKSSVFHSGLHVGHLNLLFGPVKFDSVHSNRLYLKGPCTFCSRPLLAVLKKALASNVFWLLKTHGARSGRSWGGDVVPSAQRTYFPCLRTPPAFIFCCETAKNIAPAT